MKPLRHHLAGSGLALVAVSAKAADVTTEWAAVKPPPTSALKMATQVDKTKVDAPRASGCLPPTSNSS